MKMNENHGYIGWGTYPCCLEERIAKLKTMNLKERNNYISTPPLLLLRLPR